MKKRTKIIILSVMVLLLGVTGYLNIALNKQVSDNTPPTTTTASYFVAYRNDRESLRDQEMLTYDAIIASPNSSAEAKAEAEKARLELVGLMDKELVVEGDVSCTRLKVSATAWLQSLTTRLMPLLKQTTLLTLKLLRL